MLDGAAPPTALLAGGLQLLIGTLRALDKRGLVPGRDIALVGWDDGPLPSCRGRRSRWWTVIRAGSARPPRRWR